MKTTMLCILDGYGLNPNPVGNAVAMAKKPTLDGLMATCPHSTLITYGERVGLPAGQMGNSEVGHLNIGGGREVEQWLLRISRALAGPFLNSSTAYQEFLKNTANSKRVHVVGLYSTGGVHSHAEHLHLLIKRLCKDSSADIVLHLISDGRDVSPTSFERDIVTLAEVLQSLPKVSVGSVCGRFFAMDRDKRWERIKKAYDAIVCGVGTTVVAADHEQVPADLINHISASYARGVTDEFLEPLVVQTGAWQPNDAVVFWNFREDRMREIVGATCSSDFVGFERPIPIPSANKVLCFTEYNHIFQLPYLFEQLEIKNHLGEALANLGLRQLRVAETEKYPHVTYFFNGGIETPYAGEERKVVASPRDVKTYDEKPEMSAFGVAETVVEGIRSGNYSFIAVNLANCDMVGHTGVVEAAVKAVETADTCLGQMLAALKEAGGQAIIIADHGNAEMMIDYATGTPHTAHTTFPVPVILVNYDQKVTLRSDGALCDVAPTILKMMKLNQPKEMTGTPLF